MKRFIDDLMFVIGLGFLIFVIFLVIATAAVGQETYRDSKGKMIGTSSTTKQGVTYYRDRQGRLVGTATKSGTQTFYRDGKGKVIATQQGKQSVPVPLLKKK